MEDCKEKIKLSPLATPGTQFSVMQYQSVP